MSFISVQVKQPLHYSKQRLTGNLIEVYFDSYTEDLRNPMFTNNVDPIPAFNALV